MTQQQIIRADDGYQQAEETARDYGCGDCAARLVVRWDGARYRAMCARFPDEHEHVRAYRDAAADDVRQRLERNPQVAKSMVPVRDVPLTTQAIRDLDNEKLMARVPDRYGTTIEVSKPMKLQLAQLARLYGLDPLWDLMLYEGRPYVTYDGRLRKLREHPEYRGHKVRPLNREEKEQWGYDPADLVIQCDVEMGARGTITDWGIVRASEVKEALDRAKANSKQPAPVGKHPQQIGIKRAVSRASKQAVGIDLPTIIETAGQVIVQEVQRRRLPAADAETLARRRFWSTARSGPPDGLGLSDADVHRLLGVESLSNYPGGWNQALSDLTERAAGDLPEFEDDAEAPGAGSVPEESTVKGEAQQPDNRGGNASTSGADPAPQATEPEQPMVKSVRHAMYQRLSELIQEAAEMDIPTADYQVVLPVPQVELETKLQTLGAEIARMRRQIAGQLEDDETGAMF